MNVTRFLLVLLFSSACSVADEQISRPGYAAFNELVANASKEDRPWVLHPVVVSLLFIASQSPESDAIEHQETIQLNSNAEIFDKAEVVIERTGFMDDSMAGDEYKLTLSKQVSNEWLIETVQYGWKCWEGRGHTDISDQPCL